MPRRSRVPTVFLPLLGAGVWMLTAGAPPRAQAIDPEPAIRWQHPVSDEVTVEIDVPPGWEVIEPAEAGGVTRFAPVDGPHCDVRVEFALASGARPPIAGDDALRALVDAEAQDFLDHAVESRYTLRELHGPVAAGYYFMLRDRAPRRKGAVFLNRGALLAQNAVVRFSIETPKPDLPAIRQALKMLAGSRARVAAPPPESTGTPATATSASHEAGPGE